MKLRDGTVFHKLVIVAVLALFCATVVAAYLHGNGPEHSHQCKLCRISITSIDQTTSVNLQVLFTTLGASPLEVLNLRAIIRAVELSGRSPPLI